MAENDLSAKGTKMCVEICPMKAISFTPDLPVQGDEGYDVNLRNEQYLEIGLPADDDAKIPPAQLGYGAAGTAATARCEFTGIGPFSIPEWYNRSSMGGRLASMMKEAGYDACVVKGKAESPVWINVVNDEETGWPTREGLEKVGLGFAVEELRAAGKLGGE